MQHIRKLLAVFLAVVMLSLAACSSQSASPGAATPQITIDENGLASWPPVEGAVAYHYSLVDMDCLGTEPQRTTETCVQVPAGLSVHVQAAFEDGTVGDWFTSEYYGEPASLDSVSPEIVAGPDVILDENGMASWAPVENASAYEYIFVNRDFAGTKPQRTTETCVQVPAGLSVHVQAVFEDGTMGEWLISDYYGESASQQFVSDADQPVITLDENGMASWAPVENASAYEYIFVNRDFAGTKSQRTTETCVQVPAGLSVHVQAVFEDGTMGEWLISDYYGESASQQFVFDADQPVIPLDENGMATWEPVPDAVSYFYSFINGDGIGVYTAETTETSMQVPEGHLISVRVITPDDLEIHLGDSDYFGTPSSRSIAEGEISMGMKLSDTGLLTWNPVEGSLFYRIELQNEHGNVVRTLESRECQTQLPADHRALISAVMPGSEILTPHISPFYGDITEVLPPVQPDYSEFLVYNLIPAIDPDSFVSGEDGSSAFTAVMPDGKILRFEGQGVTLTDGGLAMEPGASFVSLDAIGAIQAVRPVFSDTGAPDNTYINPSWYNFSGKTSVDSSAELVEGPGHGRHANLESTCIDPLDSSPESSNFIGFSASGYNSDDFVVSDLYIHYDPTVTHTGLKAMALDPLSYQPYIIGDPYDASLEELFDIDAGIFIFRLLGALDTEGSEITDDADHCISGIDHDHYTVGALRTADGTEVDKATALMEPGMTLDVTVGNYDFRVEVPVLSLYAGAQTLSELIPHSVPSAVGVLNTLVIPIAWQDDPHTADDALMQTFREELGVVYDMAGGVSDYTAVRAAQNDFSFTEYYARASYGALEIRPYMTDWYAAPYAFTDMMSQTPSGTFLQELRYWLFCTYPDVDWSLFDQNSDGYFDSVVFLASGDMSSYSFFYPNSFSGGVRVSRSYIPDYAATPEFPAFNDHVVVHADRLPQNTLIHEMGHTLGLIDYYDVTYSGVNAVGVYDMQSSNFGDWNVYSKYAVGWLQPRIVTGLAEGESVDITIGSSALVGDAIVIPAAGAVQDGTPFNEYIMIDLFTADEGLHQYDAAGNGLGGACGVRIYHVNAEMEYRELEHDGQAYPIGTVHVANDFKKHAPGFYLIELIQRGGVNTFTSTNFASNRAVNASDLFRAGDVFTAEAYSQFLADGLMDSGMPFGYTIEILSVSDTEATIRITR